MAKTTKKAKNHKQKVIQKHLSMHTLLDSLSFSGTVGRTLFMVFLALMCLILVFFHVNTEPGGNQNLVGGALLYLTLAVAVFAVFDATYVWLQHLHPLSNSWDRIILFVTELGAAGLFVTPFIIEVTVNNLYVNVWLPLAMVTLLAMRYITGVLFSKE